MIDNFRKNIYVYICLAVILIYLIPFFLLGQNSHVLIHDNLDSNVVWYKVLADSGMTFAKSNELIPNIMNGLPRSVYGSEFNVIVWLYNIFPPYIAYVINQILMHFIAFLGMWLLLKNHILKGNRNAISLGVSLAFALLPFWPSGGLSVAGQPLVLYAFLNFRSGTFTWRDWLIILLVPLYSSLVLSFSFFLFFMVCLCVYDFVKTKVLNLKLLLTILAMSGIYLIVEYRLVLSMFLDSGFISHRNYWLPEYVSTRYALESGIINFIYGQYHAASLQQYFIGISVMLSLFIAVCKKLPIKRLITFIVIAGLISLWYGFWNWEAWLPLKESIGILRTFNFSRFHFLHPLLWYIIFALSLIIIRENMKYGKQVVMTLIIFQCMFLFYNSDELNERKLGNPSYAEFYSEQLFNEIDDYINQDKSTYRVVNIGLHPAISQYNGFYTLDGYMANYPYSYKKEFRKIIEQELEKNEKLRNYYDNWGSRVYIFVNELDGDGFLIQKNNKLQINDLDLNTDAFQMRGGKYIFSAVEILNTEHNDLRFCKVFEREDSPWRIYLYMAN